MWQLPWVPPPTEEPPSEEEIARKAAIREKQGQRLREMAEAKRSSRINELENELHGLEFLLNQLGQVQESDVPSFLAETGYVSRQEIESARNKVVQSLRKAKGEQGETEKSDPATNEKYSLINIPDDMLTPDQVSFLYQTFYHMHREIAHPVFTHFKCACKYFAWSHICLHSQYPNSFLAYCYLSCKGDNVHWVCSFDSSLKRRNSCQSNLCLKGGSD